MPRMTNTLLIWKHSSFSRPVLLSKEPLGACGGERTSGLLDVSSLPKARGWLISF